MALKYTERMFVHLLNQAGHAVSADFVKVLRERGMTVRQWRVLGSLWDEESLTLTELAEVAFCGHSTITRLVDRLQDQGLVVRRADELDRRKAHVSLTPEARRQSSDLVAISEDMERATIDALGVELVDKMKGELREMIARLGESRRNGRRSAG